MRKAGLLILALLCAFMLSACGQTDSFESWRPPEQNTEEDQNIDEDVVSWLPGDVYSQDQNCITTYFSDYRGKIKVMAAEGYAFAVRCYAAPNYTNVLYDSGWRKEEYAYDATNGYCVIVGKKQEAITVSDGANYKVYLENTWIGEVENAEVKGVAHRGACRILPQCTAPAYIYAAAQGFTAAENDMQLTADGELVMFHDTYLGSVGLPDVAVSDMTLAELKALDFGSYVSNEFAGTKILTLAEWLSLCKELGLEPWIDVKTRPWLEENTQKAVDIVRSLGMLRDVKWLNVTAGGAAQLRALDPEAYLVWLSPPTDAIIDTVKQFKLSAEDPRVCMNPQNIYITEEWAQKILDAGIPLACWWANAGEKATEEQVREECERLFALGVRTITVDNYNPERLLAAKEVP